MQSKAAMRCHKKGKSYLTIAAKDVEKEHFHFQLLTKDSEPRKKVLAGLSLDHFVELYGLLSLILIQTQVLVLIIILFLNICMLF